MTPRFFERIWHISGSLALAPGQSSDEAFDRLDPLFRQRGTSRERSGDTLTFTKENQAPQDKMSIFDGGVLQIRRTAAGAVLYYNMKSKALLACFLAPLLFLFFSQLPGLLAKPENPAEAAAKAAKAEAAAKKPPAQLHPIDKFLGAPAPEAPKKGEESGRRSRKPSPMPGYVFAAFFAILYAAGRILEDRLIKRQFSKRLLEA
ncbi:MAG: hypothetical protein QM676_10990 [Novosphingobium sp.]